MCMFNDTPPPNQAIITKPKTAWKVFALEADGKLSFPLIHFQPLKDGWMTSKPMYEGRPFQEYVGFHVFRSWLGAWFYKKSCTPYWKKRFVIRRVKIRGQVFGVGRELCFRGLRVNEMMIPSITLIQD